MAIEVKNLKNKELIKALKERAFLNGKLEILEEVNKKPKVYLKEKLQYETKILADELLLRTL